MTNLKKWELLEEKEVSPSKWFPLFLNKVKLPNGRIVDDYYISKLGDAVMVVAITDNKEIVFVKQYKHGAGEIILELPAGLIDGRNPEEEARRELKEETGIITNKIMPLGQVFELPSKHTMQCHGFLSIGVKITQAQDLDENEEIEVVLIPVSEIEDKIKSGEIRAVDTIAFLYIAKLKYPEYFNDSLI